MPGVCPRGGDVQASIWLIHKLNLLHVARYFAVECKMLATRSSTPHVALSPPLFHLVSLALVFHGNRSSTDPSIGSPPSLRSHSTGALSLCFRLEYSSLIKFSKWEQTLELQLDGNATNPLENHSECGRTPLEFRFSGNFS